MIEIPHALFGALAATGSAVVGLCAINHWLRQQHEEIPLTRREELAALAPESILMINLDEQN